MYVFFLCYYYYYLYFSIGSNIKLLIDRSDGKYCFREKKDRVYYVSEKVLNMGSMMNPDNIISIGTCFGKFTKSGKFRIHITSLDYLAPYAQVKYKSVFSFLLICYMNCFYYTLLFF